VLDEPGAVELARIEALVEVLDDQITIAAATGESVETLCALRLRASLAGCCPCSTPTA
jgi:hypothetical protein